MGPSLKQVRATLLKQGKSVDIKDEWRQCIVDALEILNAEQHVMQTQLEGVHQAWEAVNVKLHSIGGQLRGISWGLEYLARMAWKRYTVTWGSFVSRRGGSSNEGVVRQETQEAGAGTSEAASEEVAKALEGGCEGTKHWGKWPSGLTAVDKEKRKEKEVGEEEALQEE